MDRGFSKINESLRSDSRNTWESVSRKVSTKALERTRRSIVQPSKQTSSVKGSPSVKQTGSAKGLPSIRQTGSVKGSVRQTYSTKGSSSLRQTSSAKGSSSLRQTFSTKGSSSVRQTEGSFLSSPYDARQKSRIYKKIYPNRVYVPWYKRYVDIPNDNGLNFQPFDEVLKVDEDIAMQYFFGPDGHLIDPRDRQLSEKRHMILQRYSTIKEQEQMRSHIKANDKQFKLGVKKSKSGKTNRKQSMIQKELAFGSTSYQKKIYTPIVGFLNKIHTSKNRALRKIILNPQSKWRLLNKPINKHKLAAMYKIHRTQEICHRFKRVIRMVIAVVRFVETVRLMLPGKRFSTVASCGREREKKTQNKDSKEDLEINGLTLPPRAVLHTDPSHQSHNYNSDIFSRSERSGDAKRHFREAETFRARQEQEKLKVAQMGKRMFNVNKYKLTKKLNISATAKMTLTKPWFRRVKSEIDEVVAILQTYKSFVEYPPVFQRRLATLAWYIEVEKDKYIIRERHLASDFYLLLMGKVKVIKFVGNPCIDIGGHFEFVKYIKKSESFGDECMTNPQSSRDYSVVSCERCSLLSINFHDYLQMLTTTKDNEFAPEHVIFLSNMKFLENFPKMQLMEEVDGNISIHYFRTGALMTQDLARSDYVFVVMNGACRLISPMFRFEEMLQEGYQMERAEQCEPTPSHGPSSHSRVGSEDSSIERIIEERNIAHLPRYYMQVRDRARSLGHQLRHICVPESALIDEYRNKIKAACRTIPRERRDSLFGGIDPQLVDVKEILYPTSDSDYVEGRSLLRKSISGYIEFSPSRSGNFDGQIQRSSETGFGRRKNDLANSLAGYIDILTTHSTSVHRETTKQFLPGSHQQSRTSELNLREHRKDLTKSFSGLDDIWSARSVSSHKLMTPHLEGESAATLPQSFVEQSEQETTFSQRAMAKSLQKWKLLRTMVRGDAAGQEYLDYNEGPFTAPVGMISVVSDGCEVIMMKRKLLLRYLRKEW